MMKLRIHGAKDKLSKSLDFHFKKDTWSDFQRWL